MNVCILRYSSSWLFLRQFAGILKFGLNSIERYRDYLIQFYLQYHLSENCVQNGHDCNYTTEQFVLEQKRGGNAFEHMPIGLLV